MCSFLELIVLIAYGEFPLYFIVYMLISISMLCTNTVYSNLLIFPFGIIEENGCLLYWEKFEDTKEVIRSVNTRRADNTKR